MTIIYGQEKFTMSGFTQVDNVVFDVIMPMLSESQFKVFMAIYRNTIGYQDGLTKILSTSYLMKFTGLSNRVVIQCVKKLNDIGFICTEKGYNNANKITLNIREINNYCEKNKQQAMTNSHSLPSKISYDEKSAMTESHNQSDEKSQQAMTNSHTINKNINTNINKNICTPKIENSDVIFSDDEISHFENSYTTENFTTWENPTEQEISNPQENLNQEISQPLEKNLLPPSENVPPAGKKKTSKTETVQKPAEVSEQTWKDFLTVRKSHKAPLTVTAWNTALGEITKTQEKTGHSLEQIMTVWVSKGWRGFKADWYLNHMNQSGNQFYAPANDRLAVNKNWQPQNDGIIRTSTATIEEMF